MSEKLSDKIVNHLISKYVLQPIILPLLVSSNVATRKDKGTKAAMEYFKYYVHKLKQKHDKIYVLKCDIRKYFYNIDHEILFSKIKKILFDKDLLRIIENILKSTDYEYVNRKISRVVDQEILRLKQNKNMDLNRIKELENIANYPNGKGIPIGNMSSQILALLYLNDLDHYIKEELKIKYYIRYMDNFLLFHSNKEYLKYCKQKIEEKVDELKLKLNKKTQIYDLNHGMVFVGYRFLLRKKKLYVLMSSKNKRKIVRKLNYLQKNDPQKYELVKASYNGYLLNSSCDAFLF